MSDQREMTLDEYLESKLPDFHLARRQLQELREESDALSAHVERLRGDLELARDRIALLAEIATDRGAKVYAALDMWPEEMAKILADSPETSLARLKAEWQSDGAQMVADSIRYDYEGEIHQDRIADHADEVAEKLRRQAGEAKTPDEPWQCVPVEPTPEMMQAGYWSGSSDVSVNESWARREVWNRMLAAAPKPEDV